MYEALEQVGFIFVVAVTLITVLACLCGWRDPRLVGKGAPKKFTGMLALYGCNHVIKLILPTCSDPYTP